MGGVRVQFLLFLTTLLVCPILHAKDADPLIISGICVDRAQQLNIIPNASKETLLKYLRQSKAGANVYNFANVSKAYEESLQQVNSQLEDNESPLFKFLENCNEYPRECHGYIAKMVDLALEKPKFEFKYSNHTSIFENWYKPWTYDTKDLVKLGKIYQNVFCDREIFQNTSRGVKEDRRKSFDKCSDEPFMEMRLDVLEGNPSIHYDKDCFERVKVGDVIFLRNKSSGYVEKYKVADTWEQKFQRQTYNAVTKSLLPEGMTFIINKAVEELADPELRDQNKKILSNYYNNFDLAVELGACCKDNGLKIKQFQINAGKLNLIALDIAKKLKQPDAITFQPQDLLSKMVFKQAKREYWKKFLAKSTVLEMSPKDKFKYYKFRQLDPFFDDSIDISYDAFVKEAKSRPRSYYQNLPMPNNVKQKAKKGSDDYIPTQGDIEAYFYTYYKKHYYDPIKKRDFFLTDGHTDFKDVAAVTNKFIRDPFFQTSYLSMLKKKSDDVDQKVFDQEKIDRYYRRFHKGFLPYQFIRTAHAQVLRELQKQSKKDADGKLADKTIFLDWVHQFTCGVKPQKVFCKDGYKELRDRGNSQLFWAIKRGTIVLNHALPGQRRNYLYDKDVLNEVNVKIKFINQFCYDNANEKKFKQHPEQYSELVQDLQGHMHSFVAIDHFREVVISDEFSSVFQYKDSDFTEKCFSKGYLFGTYGTDSELGRQVKTRHYFDRKNGSSFDNDGLAPGLTIHQGLVASTFQVRPHQIRSIEDDIESKIRGEYTDLNSAVNLTSLNEIKKFLQESARKRVAALVDYAQDNPSTEIGHYICDAIMSADISEDEKIRQIETIKTWSSVVAIAGTAFIFAPEAFVVISNAAISTIMLTAGVVSANMQRQYFNRMNYDAMVTALTSDIDPLDVMAIHDVGDEQVADAVRTMTIEVGTFAVLGAFPIFKTKGILQRMLDKNYKLISSDRMVRLEKIYSQNPGTIREVLPSKVEDFLRDSYKVSPADFDAFEAARISGKGTEYILGKWPSLKRYFPSARELPEVAALKPRVVPALLKPLARIQPYLTGFLKFFNNELPNEVRIVRMLDTETKNGERIFTNAEREFYVNGSERLGRRGMKHFRIVNGEIERTAKAELDQNLDLFLQQAVTGNKERARAYLAKIVYGELLLPEQWEVLAKTVYNFPFETMDDLRGFSKIIKYMKKEYGTREQARNAREIFNFRELLKPTVYRLRTDDILAKINPFRRYERYMRYNRYLREVEDFQAMMSKTGQGIDSIENKIRTLPSLSDDAEQLYLKEEKFDLRSKIDNVPVYKKFIREFEEQTPGLVTRNGNKLELVKLGLWRDPLKYEKIFLRQEKKYNDLFSKKFKKIFARNGNNIAAAYKESLFLTRTQKQIAYECSLPESGTRAKVNAQYENLAKYISLGTGVMGYVSAHGREDINTEWWSRFAYDIGLGYFNAWLLSKIFTSKGGGPVFKIFWDYLSANAVSGVSAVMYNQLSTHVWTSKEKYRSQLADAINGSSEPDKALDKLFKANPKLLDEIKRRFMKMKAAMTEMQLRSSKGTFVESEMIKELTDQGLLSDLKYDGKKFQNVPASAAPFMKRLVSDGYVDPENFLEAANDEDREDQINALLAQDNFNQLYEPKSGQLRYPFFDPFEVGNLDPAFQLKSKNQGWNRFRFYAFYDLGLSPFNYFKNSLTYFVLCKGRDSPGSLLAALLIHMTYTSIMDPLGFYLREESTGR